MSVIGKVLGAGAKTAVKKTVADSAKRSSTAESRKAALRLLRRDDLKDVPWEQVEGLHSVLRENPDLVKVINNAPDHDKLLRDLQAGDDESVDAVVSRVSGMAPKLKEVAAQRLRISPSDKGKGVPATVARDEATKQSEEWAIRDAAVNRVKNQAKTSGKNPRMEAEGVDTNVSRWQERGGHKIDPHQKIQEETEEIGAEEGLGKFLNPTARSKATTGVKPRHRGPEGMRKAGIPEDSLNSVSEARPTRYGKGRGAEPGWNDPSQSGPYERWHKRVMGYSPEEADAAEREGRRPEMSALGAPAEELQARLAKNQRQTIWDTLAQKTRSFLGDQPPVIQKGRPLEEITEDTVDPGLSTAGQTWRQQRSAGEWQPSRQQWMDMHRQGPQDPRNPWIGSEPKPARDAVAALSPHGNVSEIYAARAAALGDKDLSHQLRTSPQWELSQWRRHESDYPSIMGNAYKIPLSIGGAGGAIAAADAASPWLTGDYKDRFPPVEIPHSSFPVGSIKATPEEALFRDVAKQPKPRYEGPKMYPASGNVVGADSLPEISSRADTDNLPVYYAPPIVDPETGRLIPQLYDVETKQPSPYYTQGVFAEGQEQGNMWDMPIRDEAKRLAEFLRMRGGR